MIVTNLNPDIRAFSNSNRSAPNCDYNMQQAGEPGNLTGTFAENSNSKRIAPNFHYNLLRPMVPDFITQQNTVGCSGQEGLQGSKGSLWLDCQANT
jgi:hypothetical protein